MALYENPDPDFAGDSEFKTINENVYLIGNEFEDICRRHSLQTKDFAYIPPPLPLLVSKALLTELSELGIAEPLEAIKDALIEDSQCLKWERYADFEATAHLSDDPAIKTTYSLLLRGDCIIVDKA